MAVKRRHVPRTSNVKSIDLMPTAVDKQNPNPNCRICPPTPTRRPCRVGARYKQPTELAGHEVHKNDI